MSTSYLSNRYTPPIPVLRVRFSRISGDALTDALHAVVDTGADMTIAPLSLMEQLEALSVVETELLTQWGDAHPVTLYLVDAEIEDLKLPGVYVAGDETAGEIILGRNIINKLPLFLDGPKGKPKCWATRR